MNNSFSLQQISRTRNLDPSLITRQNKLNRMAKFMQIKFENRKLKEYQTAGKTGCSFGTVKRYRKYFKMLSPYRN